MTRETFERIAKLVGANTTEGCTVFSFDVNDQYFISVTERIFYKNHKAFQNIHMNLVKNADTGRAFDNKTVAFEVIKVGATDKVIINKYNKLLSMAQ